MAFPWHPVAPRLLILIVLLMSTALVASRGWSAEDLSRGADRIAARAGWLVSAPDGVAIAERLQLEPGVVPLLLATPVEDTVRLQEWPIAPGERAPVRLTHHDVYARDAQIWSVGSKGPVEVPRSRLVFFSGVTENEAATRVLAIADPERETVEAFSDSEEGWQELRAVASSSSGEYLLAPSQSLLGEAAGRLTRDCAQGEVALAVPFDLAKAAIPESGSPELFAGLRTSTIAYDTDNELLAQKFSDNTTAATNYIASLTALMSTIYERDLNLRLLQGTTYLRPSSQPDPWAQSGTGNADGAKLNEFRSYWSSNYGSVSRASAMLLSGKQSNAYSSSGIAYVDVFCNTSFGYAVVQVFKFPGSTASNDVQVCGHELGHNAGSKHTHCYVNPTPIDTCYAGESGCYSGATSCPAAQTINGVPNVRGTIMSYCHLLGGCGVSNVFHPRTVDLLTPIFDSKTGVCIFPVPNPKEASPSGDLRASRSPSGSSVTVTYAPACGATDHVVYAGNLDSLAAGGIAWTQRVCDLETTGTLTFDAGAGNIYFVVAGNNGTTEGSYGRGSSGAERPFADPGGACSFTQDLSGSCP